MRKAIGFSISNDLTCAFARLFFRVITLLLLVVVNLTVAGTCLANDENVVSHILYINSYHPGYSWSDDIEKGLRERLESSGRKIELSLEYLDTRRFIDPILRNELTDIILANYRDSHHDLIVVSDNAAFDFAIKNREHLFPDIPIVFCGYNNFRPEVLRGLTNITGVNEEINIGAFIETALFIQPKIRTLAFILSTGEASRKIVADMVEESIVPKYQDQYEIILLKDASISRIKKTLASLPRESALFLLGQTSDRGDGRALTPIENGRLISAISPVPVYTLWDFHFDTGVLGGPFLTGYDQGKAAGEMALQILNGKKAEEIPVLKESPTSYVFDYKVMQRFNIARDALPKNSTVINKPYSFYEAHIKIVWITIIVIISLSSLVIGLFLNILRRQRAEKELQKHRNHLEELVKERTAELSDANKALKDSEGRFRSLSNATFEGIVISEKGIIREVNEAMIRMFGYDRQEFIGMSATDLIVPDLRRDVSNRIRSGYKLPYEIRCLKKDGNQFPVEVHGRMFSYKNLQARVTAIRDISDRKRIQEERENALDRLVAVFDSIDAIVYVADMNSYEVLFVNRYGRDIFGDETVGEICWQVLQKGQTGPCDFCTNKYLLDNEGNPTETYTLEMQNTVNGRWYLIRDKAIKWIDGRMVRVQIATDITDRKQIEKEREALISKLEKALDEIKTLRGILPICSFCKNIRNDEGYYEQIDEYIHKHSGVDFSHTVCPTCMKKHYPEVYESMKKKIHLRSNFPGRRLQYPEGNILTNMKERGVKGSLESSSVLLNEESRDQDPTGGQPSYPSPFQCAYVAAVPTCPDRYLLFWLIFRSDSFPGSPFATSHQGLISRTGVPSTMSSPLTRRTLSRIAMTCIIDIPMGLGRIGEQILNTPFAFCPCGGV